MVTADPIPRLAAGDELLHLGRRQCPGGGPGRGGSPLAGYSLADTRESIGDEIAGAAAWKSGTVRQQRSWESQCASGSFQRCRPLCLPLRGLICCSRFGSSRQRLHGAGDLRIEESLFDPGSLAPGEVFVRTEFTALSTGTDLGNFEGRSTEVPGAPDYPRAVGYSNAGVVTQRASAYSRLSLTAGFSRGAGRSAGPHSGWRRHGSGGSSAISSIWALCRSARCVTKPAKMYAW